MGKIIKFPGVEFDPEDPDKPLRQLAEDLLPAFQLILALFFVAQLVYGAVGLVHGLANPGAPIRAAWIGGAVLATAWVPGLLAWRLQEAWARWAAVSYFCVMVMVFIL